MHELLIFGVIFAALGVALCWCFVLYIREGKGLLQLSKDKKDVIAERFFALSNLRDCVYGGKAISDKTFAELEADIMDMEKYKQIATDFLTNIDELEKVKLRSIYELFYLFYAECAEFDICCNINVEGEYRKEYLTKPKKFGIGEVTDQWELFVILSVLTKSALEYCRTYGGEIHIHIDAKCDDATISISNTLKDVSFDEHLNSRMQNDGGGLDLANRLIKRHENVSLQTSAENGVFTQRLILTEPPAEDTDATENKDV